MHATQQNPGGDQSNPYDFILKDPPKQKRSLLPKTDSKKQRIIVMIGLALAIIAIMILVVSLFTRQGSSGFVNLENIAKQQEEIARIAEIGERQARSSETQSYATSIKLSVSSSQKEILTYLASKNRELKDKDLALLQDGKTDTKLQAAIDAGQFDTVFTTEINRQLKAYQADLSKYYDATGSKAQKELLQTAYGQVKIILDKPSSTDTTP